MLRRRVTCDACGAVQIDRQRHGRCRRIVPGRKAIDAQTRWEILTCLVVFFFFKSVWGARYEVILVSRIS